MRKEGEVDYTELVLAIWQGMLGTMLGWSKDRVNGWAERRQRERQEPLSDPNSWWYHDTLAWPVVPELIPQRIKAELHVYDLMKLESRIEHAILAGNPDGDLRGDYDWNAARDRVESILNEFGESLTNVREEHRNSKA